MSEDISHLRFRTASGAAVAEDALRSEGRSYRTKIVKTKKRGLEYVVTVLATQPAQEPMG